MSVSILPNRQTTRPRHSRKVVTITGASAGIGLATAFAFARRGWAVALVARGEERLRAAKQQLDAGGAQSLALPADVADPSALSGAADAVVQAWGRLDVWVNNAMATVYAPADEMTPEEFARVTEVTYLGQVHGSLAALRHMRRQGRGTIVQVGSALAYRSIPLQSAYCGAKAAVRGFTDSLRSELIHENSPVRITMVQLPAVNTPQFEWARSRLLRRLQPVPPIYDPDVAAEAIFRASQNAPRELWVGVPTIQAVMGTMLAPTLLDRVMARRAWDGQMSDEPAVPRPGNLFVPVEGGFSARGRFTARSNCGAISTSASVARAMAAAAGLGVAAALTLLITRGATRATADSGNLFTPAASNHVARRRRGGK